jgi:4-diphosphocytidyl-2-C-methyl-D-erythritol kinase
MVTFPLAKINLGLRVTSKRPDGYHNLDTVFYPLPLCDVLEIIPQQKKVNEEILFTTSGKEVPGNASNNLCVKAYFLWKKEYPSLPPLHVHLHKNIPMGAGMGGGSSDAAFMLTMMNQKFKLGLDIEQLTSFALSLGSDCPFFITHKPVHATGRGEIMNPIDCDLSKKCIVLVSPGIHISTADAFGNIEITSTGPSCAELVLQPVEEWKLLLKNDFEKTVFPLYPVLAQIKTTLYEMGAQYASMTGSGSTIFGIFSTPPNMEPLSAFASENFIIENGSVKKTPEQN